MSLTVFIDSKSRRDHAGTLSDAIADLCQGRFHETLYIADPQEFPKVAGKPFAYWLPPALARQFRLGMPVASGNTTAKQGLATADDFRFIRLMWEHDSRAGCPGLESGNPRWAPFSKGGQYSRYYADVHLTVNWANRGAEIRARVNPVTGMTFSNVHMLEQTEARFFYQRGLTWSRRSQRGLSLRALPDGCVFADKGPCVFSDDESLLSLLGIMNSGVFRELIAAQMAFGSFEVGVIGQTPAPNIDEAIRKTLDVPVRKSIEATMRGATASDVTHLFHLPALLQTDGPTLIARATAWQSRLDAAGRELEDLQQQIDDIVFDLYGLGEEDRSAILESAGEVGAEAEADEEEVEETTVDARTHVVDLLSYCVGVAVGRFDVRYATGELAAPELPDPFAPLPACSPGMLTGEDGLPLGAEPAGYPLRVSWDGVLVDDLGLDNNGRPHREDIVARVREVLALLFGPQAEEIEHEACTLLGAKALRDFFAKPSGFFAEHLKRYSKSRRQAPIYWPLSTTSGSYTLWLYYHRLSDDLLYTAVNRYVEPKASEVQRRLNEIAVALPTAAGKQAAELRKKHEELTTLQGELAELSEELLRVAALPYKPDLDDGVLICASPLARLFRLTKWRKDLEACWKKLERGDFDWAHLAYAIWPERVLEACRRDRSIAIAHGVEGE